MLFFRHLQWAWKIISLSTKLSEELLAIILTRSMICCVYICKLPRILKGFGLKSLTLFRCHCKSHSVLPSAHGLWSFLLLEADVGMPRLWISGPHLLASAQASSLHSSALSSAYQKHNQNQPHYLVFPRYNHTNRHTRERANMTQTQTLVLYFNFIM